MLAGVTRRGSLIRGSEPGPEFWIWRVSTGVALVVLGEGFQCDVSSSRLGSCYGLTTIHLPAGATSFAAESQTLGSWYQLVREGLPRILAFNTMAH